MRPTTLRLIGVAYLVLIFGSLTCAALDPFEPNMSWRECFAVLLISILSSPVVPIVDTWRSRDLPSRAKREETFRLFRNPMASFDYLLGGGRLKL